MSSLRVFLQQYEKAGAALKAVNLLASRQLWTVREKAKVPKHLENYAARYFESNKKNIRSYNVNEKQYTIEENFWRHWKNSPDDAINYYLSLSKKEKTDLLSRENSFGVGPAHSLVACGKLNLDQLTELCNNLGDKVRSPINKNQINKYLRKIIDDKNGEPGTIFLDPEVLKLIAGMDPSPGGSL